MGWEGGTETRATHFHRGMRVCRSPRSLAWWRVNHLYFRQRNQSNPLVTPLLTAYFICRESIRPSSAAHPAGYLLHSALVPPPPSSLLNLLLHARSNPITAHAHSRLYALCLPDTTGTITQRSVTQHKCSKTTQMLVTQYM